MAGSDERGDDLDRRISAAQAQHQAPVAKRGETRGMAVGVEFVGAVLVSAFIGWLIDRAAHTTPWFMIVFLVLGLCAGVRRAMQTASEFDVDADAPKAGKVADDDED